MKNNTISEFYLNKASYIAVDSSGTKILLKVDYWNGTFKTNKNNQELEIYGASLLENKHKVNFVYKLQNTKEGEYYMKKEIRTVHAPQAIGPYSQAIVAGNLVFTAGQIYLDPEGNLIEGTIEEKTHQIMKNLRAILQASGVTFGDVVKTTTYITDASIFGRMNTVYMSYLEEPYPARETVIVKELPKGAMIEMSMIASKA